MNNTALGAENKKKQTINCLGISDDTRSTGERNRIYP